MWKFRSFGLRLSVSWSGVQQTQANAKSSLMPHASCVCLWICLSLSSSTRQLTRRKSMHSPTSMFTAKTTSTMSSSMVRGKLWKEVGPSRSVSVFFLFTFFVSVSLSNTFPSRVVCCVVRFRSQFSYLFSLSLKKKTQQICYEDSVWGRRPSWTQLGSWYSLARGNSRRMAMLSAPVGMGGGNSLSTESAEEPCLAPVPLMNYPAPCTILYAFFYLFNISLFLSCFSFLLPYVRPAHREIGNKCGNVRTSRGR